MPEENIYSAPKAELSVEPIDGSEFSFFPTSQTKLIILFIATFGAYTVYWFYKNWKLQQERMEKKIRPVVRSVFYIFFTHSFFKRVEEAAIEKEISKSWNASLLATILVILTIVSNVLDRVSARTETYGVVDFASVAIVFVILIPIYMVQEVVNKINADPQGRLNSSFSIYNFIFIVLGVLMWVVLGVGLFQIDVSFLDQFFT